MLTNTTKQLGIFFLLCSSIFHIFCQDGHGFTRETLVRSLGNFRPLDDLSDGSEITSFDFKWFCYRRVIDKHSDAERSEVMGVWVVDYHGSKELDLIKCGYKQKFYVANRGRWVEAQSLADGDILLSRTHGLVRCSTGPLCERRHLVSLETDDLHNYLVGKYAILVHNN